MKCAIIGTYPPRECGIATFTFDLYNSMESDDQTFIIAINDPDQHYDYPEEVAYVIREDKIADYKEAADYINKHADICLLQHEFNIFGGDAGLFLLSLLNRLEIPLVSTLHTVLKKPSISQHFIIRQICSLSERIIALSQVASDILSSTYRTRKEKIAMIRHGVPQIRLDPENSKKVLNFSGKKVLMTFGLINRNKGIETVIKSLPAVIRKHPEVRYVVLGKTHPSVHRLFGEEYREYLEHLVKELDLQEHVRFVNRFIGSDELNLYLSATDILITPYHVESQVSSGPLSFAMGAGAALISTPFWHARELLAEGRGRLFDFRDYEKLSLILNDLLDDPRLLLKYRKKAAAFGQRIIWPVIGHDYLSLLQAVMESSEGKRISKSAVSTKYPGISLKHIRKLTDSTGIISDAVYCFPNLKNGYRLEDNCRALYAATMAYNHLEKENIKSLIFTYLSFIHLMQQPDGTFKSHLKYSRIPSDEKCPEECLGIVLWALGYLINNSPDYGCLELAKDIFKKAVKGTEKLKEPRSIAYSLIGLYHYLDAFRLDQIITERFYSLHERMKALYEKNRSEDWRWYEPNVSYDSAALPHAMMLSGELLQDKRSKVIALESLGFLTDIVISNGHLSLIGNMSWYKKGEEKSIFDQLPADAMGLILLYKRAYEITRDKRFYKLARICYNWFFGRNDLHVYLYDEHTGGCYDGLQEDGVNRNQGAESSLAFLISNMSIKDLRKIRRKEKKVK